MHINKGGIAITSISLNDANGHMMQKFDRVRAPGLTTLGDYAEELRSWPLLYSAVIEDPAAGDASRQREAIMIEHTPEENRSLMMRYADAPLSAIVRGKLGLKNTRKALGEAAWALAIAAPLQGGSASSTDMLSKALMKACNVEIQFHPSDGLNWDIAAMAAPTREEFVGRYMRPEAPDGKRELRGIQPRQALSTERGAGAPLQR